MDVILKLEGDLYEIQYRSRKTASVRNGTHRLFAVGRSATAAEGTEIVLLNRFHSFPDEHYVEDLAWARRIEGDDMEMQAAYSGRAAPLHFFPSATTNSTGMSAVDRREIRC